MTTPIEWNDACKTFTYRGHRIRYRIEGEGEPLILIHGFPTASWDWHRVWDTLTQRYRVLAADMIGFGFSDKPARYAYSLFDQADLHEALLAELQIESAHILAHDYGDTVAQELFARAADDELSISLESVCMLNGGIIAGKHRPRPTQALLIGPFGPIVARLMSESRFHKAFAAIFGPDTKPTKEELHHFWSLIKYKHGHLRLPRIIRYMQERKDNFDRWVGVLRDPPRPLHLIFGDQDPVSGAHMAEAYTELAREPSIDRLPTIGHYPQTEAPDAVLQRYQAFRDRL